jgi:hypothetical protein
MATRNIVPRANGEGSIGTAAKHWGAGHFDTLPNWQEYLAESTGYGIVSGCEPTISGLTVTVGAGIVHLADGTRKEMSATNVTLDAADTTNPRIDLVYITSVGDVAKITGTAAASPSAPALPSGGISVAQVSVAANASTGTVTDNRGMLPRFYNTGIVNVKDFGAVGDGVTDDTAAINSALSSGNKVVIFPKGYTFFTSAPLLVRSNTEIILDATITAKTAEPPNYTGFFAFYDNNNVTPAYSGVHDVYFHGTGVFDACADKYYNQNTPLRLYHARNIVIEGITIKNYGGYHGVEIGGCENILLKNILFSGAISYAGAGESGKVIEAIQLERTEPGGGADGNPLDNTPPRNITIDGCIFEPNESNDGPYLCIGSHTRFNDSTKSPEKTYENITIQNCIFRNIGAIDESTMVEDAYFAPIDCDSNYKNLKIINNSFVNVNHYYCINVGIYSENVTIRDNFFYNIRGSAIRCDDTADVEISSNHLEKTNMQNLSDESVTGLIPAVYLPAGAQRLKIENNFIKTHKYVDKLYHMPGSAITNTVNSVYQNNTIVIPNDTENKNSIVENAGRFVIPQKITLYSGELSAGSAPLLYPPKYFDMIEIVVNNEEVTDVKQAVMQGRTEQIRFSCSNISDTSSDALITLYEMTVSCSDNNITINTNSGEAITKDATGYATLTAITTNLLKVTAVYGYNITNRFFTV